MGKSEPPVRTRTRQVGVIGMSRIFMSHASRDARAAVALKQWLVEQDPSLADEIFLDRDPATGIKVGERWKSALIRANSRCEAVICLMSSHWDASDECRIEYRTAENLHKEILCARLEPSVGEYLTSDWQRCDLFGDDDQTAVDIDGGEPVVFATGGLLRLRDGVRSAGIGASHFAWPPPNDPHRTPYRGWEPLSEAGVGQRGPESEVLARTSDTRDAVRQTQPEHESQAMARVGLDGNRLRTGVPRVAGPAGRVVNMVRPPSLCTWSDKTKRLGGRVTAGISPARTGASTAPRRC